MTAKNPTLFIAIGASAGGLRALKEFFSSTKRIPGATYFVAQHLDKSGKTLAATTLKTVSKMKVLTAQSGEVLRDDCIYSIPPHSLVSFENGKIQLKPASTTSKKLAVIDSLFRSLGAEFSEHAVGVVLSGEAHDGAQGVRHLNASGGLTLAQTPESAEYPSMPESAIATGTVDHVLSPKEIFKTIANYAVYLSPKKDDKKSAILRNEITAALASICELLSQKTKHDFKHYKSSTLLRRIQRRMHVLQISTVQEYLDHLHAEKNESDVLFKELLINVTSFFRDKESFEALREEVLQQLLAETNPTKKIRIWVAGCSTGEEAYTIAILIRELFENKTTAPEVQIIATDIDDAALNVARRGAYPLTIAEHISQERLTKYFTKRGGKYHVNKDVREMCLFSIHNLITDPPFSQLDLITCRNVLIYMGLHLQQKLFPVFHYALRNNGYIFLGTSETLTSHRELFKPVNTKHRIAQRRPTAIKMPSITSSVQNYLSHFQENEKVTDADLGLICQRIALDEMPLRYAAVNDEGQILSSSAGLNKYVQIPEGTFQNNIIRLVTPTLRAALRAAFKTAKKEKRKIVNDTCTLRLENIVERTSVIVQPMPQLGGMSELYWIAFQNLGAVLGKEPKTTPRIHTAHDADLVDELERELTVVRQELDKSIQDLEASNEELKSSNEELLSMNEELQSANEELETSKEEVQSSNDALQRANTDLENLLASTQIATLFLDDEYKIRGFTPAIQDIYNIKPVDLGRNLSDFTSRAPNIPPYPQASEVSADLAHEAELMLSDGRIFLRRVHPYRTADDARDGLVVTFVNVTELRRAENARKESDQRFKVMADSAPVLVWIADQSRARTWFNKAWLDFTGESMDVSLGEGWTRYVHPDDLKIYLETYEHHYRSRSPFQLEYRLRFNDGSYRWISARGVPLFTSTGEFNGFIGACLDINEQKRLSEAVKSSETHFRTLVDKSPAVMWITNRAAECTYLSQQWYEITGRTPEQDLGFGWVENCHPDDKEAAGKAFFSAIEERGKISIRYRLRQRDGSYRWAIDSGLPLRSDNGEFLGYIGTVVDIHDQVESEAQYSDLRERFNRSVEATDLGVWYCDLPFDELIWNKEVKKHFFMSPDARVDINLFYAHIHPDDRDRTRKAIQYSIDNRSSYDIFYRTFDPHDQTKLNWIRAIGWTDYDDSGNPIRFDGITLNVTTEYTRQEELKRAKDDAEKAKKFAEIANESKTRFLANMSHEIRTPLSAIVGFSDLLRSKMNADNEANSYIERISRNSNQLSRLIDELLDLSKIEADKLEVEHSAFDIDSVIEDVKSAMMLKAHDKGIQLDFNWVTEKPDKVFTDPIRLSQILINVVGNAVKFTEAGSVTVELSIKNEKFAARVKDTGIGLSKSQQARIFEPFMQADPSVTRKYGGTGLGLALAKKLAVLLGGDLLLLESELDKGSVFLVEISTNGNQAPVTATQKESASEIPATALKDKTILVVDDSPDNRVIVSLYLKGVGAKVLEARNGEEGVRLALENKFDLVLMDIQMPVMDGYRAIHALREKGYKPPVIALTAHAFKEEKERCMAAGFTSYVTKPIQRSTLLKVIFDLLGGVSAS